MTKLPDDDLKRSKHVGVVLSVLKCFKWKLYRCICWLIVEVFLRNARCNYQIHVDWIFLIGRRHGGEWPSRWHWTERFTIPAINSWPKFPHENQMSIPFAVQRHFQCFLKTTELLALDRSAHTICCYVSEQLITSDKTRRKRSDDFKVTDNYLTGC